VDVQNAIPCVDVQDDGSKLTVAAEMSVRGESLEVVRAQFQLDSGSTYDHVCALSLGKVFKKSWFGTSKTIGSDGSSQTQVFALVQRESLVIPGVKTVSGGFAVVSSANMIGRTGAKQLGAVLDYNGQLCFQSLPHQLGRQLPSTNDPWLTWEEMRSFLQDPQAKVDSLIEAGNSDAVVGLDLGVSQAVIDLGYSGLAPRDIDIGNKQKPVVLGFPLGLAGLAPRELMIWDDRKPKAPAPDQQSRVAGEQLNKLEH